MGLNRQIQFGIKDSMNSTPYITLKVCYARKKAHPNRLNLNNFITSNHYFSCFNLQRLR